MKKVIYIIALLIGATTMAQTITVNGTPMLVSDDISFPFWLESGSSISPEVPVSSISVLEFNIVPNNNGNDMVFNQVISVTEGQTVPEGKTWKVESILMENQEFIVDSSNTSLDSAFVASMIAEAISTGIINNSFEPNISLLCVDMGVSNICPGLGLNPNVILNPSNYIYSLGQSNNLDQNNYEIEPHWRKFELVGLAPFIAYGGRLMFKYRSYYYSPYSTPASQESYPEIAYVTPEVDDDKIYFYLYGENSTGGDCLNEMYIQTDIPISNSLQVLSEYVYNGNVSLGSKTFFEIFYESDQGVKSTGLFFDIN